MERKLQGIFTPVTNIRRQVFTAVARYAYERNRDVDTHKEFYSIPYEISPDERPRYRDSVLVERAVARERARLALGMPVRPVNEYLDLATGFDEVDVSESAIAEPLVNVIPFACEACPTKTFRVTANCRRCIAHPCTNVCPKKCITITRNGAVIDEDACIRCGRCLKACPYNAIIEFGRPCADACGAKAIDSDELGRAKIDYDKCVSCGMCMASCPFGAIADKSEIFQIINAIRDGTSVVAEIAPAFVGQFGPLATPGKIFNGIKELGFADVVEVGIGADVSTLHEAKEFLELVPEKQPFMSTSCCPAWADFAKQVLPEEMKGYVSASSTPMVATAELIKETHPEAKIVFIGPCVAKKGESLRDSVRPYVDFVLTFEELMGMFVARNIELSQMPEEFDSPFASSKGRSYAVASNVCSAISDAILQLKPELGEVKVQHADSLAECRKMLMLAKNGKYDGYLLEGMACPGGCVGGAGTLAPLAQSAKAVQDFADASPYERATESPHTVN